MATYGGAPHLGGPLADEGAPADLQTREARDGDVSHVGVEELEEGDLKKARRGTCVTVCHRVPRHVMVCQRVSPSCESEFNRLDSERR